MPVRAVLWDADGVLQQGPIAADPFFEVLGDRAEEFGSLVWGRLDDALAGRLPMADHVASVLHELGLEDRRDGVLALWDRIEPLPGPRALVAQVRASGLPCYLATNQDDLRARRMRALLDYDELLDGSYYSCELGVAKPDPAYFTAIAADLGLVPEELLFVDDAAVNVAGARAVGLVAEEWHHERGVEALRDLLVGHGLSLG